jgi:hypothetical protein
MLFPNTIYMHMQMGLGDYVHAHSPGKTLEEAYRYVTYYRSGVQVRVTDIIGDL